ncbi:unnamed protein product [Didymodactylos carnosus]|nr:unnamed protein product [Didymodactylos carnosus]CAF3787724.1 unnamed protein product [Didymodactylos carnosus]
MAYADEIKLDIKFYDQVWSSMDLNPDRLTNEINKMFIYNETETKRHNYSDNYFDYDKQYVQSSGISGSAGLNIFGVTLGGSGSTSSSSGNQLSTTTQSIFSATEIQHIISQEQIDIQWSGEKFIPKSFSVYKMTDLTDHLQTAIIAKQLIADKANGAIIRTVNAIKLPVVSLNSRTMTFTGEIKLYTGNVTSIPKLWLLCDGTSLSRIEYQRLFSVIGTTYGAGDGSTKFNLPDFRGRFPMGVDELKIRVNEATHLGQAGGKAMHQLSVAELPAHKHDKGTLAISANGAHSHTYRDPGHNHGGQTGDSAPQDGGGRGTVSGGGIHDRGRHVHTIAIDKTSISIDMAGSHIHDIIGEMSSVGLGQQFQLISPFQTCNYIIYTG